MRSGVSSCVAAAAVLAAGLGIGPGGPQASACGGGDCGGYAPAYYYAPPVYSYAVPAAPYAPPPAYAYGPSAYWGVYAPTYYTTRVNIFHAPRWSYAAAYYHPVGRVRHWHCPYAYHPRWHRAYVYGPCVHRWHACGRW
jgi:hypothetical protein